MPWAQLWHRPQPQGPYTATASPTASELVEVLDLARTGQVGVEVQRYTLDQGAEAYEALAAGTVRGRAVIVP